VPIADNLVATCETEWDFFRRSRINLDGTSAVGLREYDDGAWQRIGDYWEFIGGAYKNLTGMDRGTAWSAAFISWCMQSAGAGEQFPYSAGHAHYINTAIRNAAQGDGTLIGHRLNAYAPRVGDLIGYWRGSKAITFDNARQVGWYESHTDVVVEVGDRVLYSVGGNVLHSVTRRAVKLNARGHVIDRRQNWFVAIENRI
jgi:hypothetical protein